MVWGDALKILRRAVQVIRAKPDPGALVLSTTLENDGDTSATSSDSDEPGWVAFEIRHYESGNIVRQETRQMTQGDFAEFLRLGVYP